MSDENEPKEVGGGWTLERMEQLARDAREQTSPPLWCAMLNAQAARQLVAISPARRRANMLRQALEQVRDAAIRGHWTTEIDMPVGDQTIHELLADLGQLGYSVKVRRDDGFAPGSVAISWKA